MTDEPFGRQPKSVTVIVVGELEDRQYWVRILAQRAEFKGDNVDRARFNNCHMFQIHPRAVND